MPPTKRKKTSLGNKGIKRSRSKNGENNNGGAEEHEVEKVLSCRLDPKDPSGKSLSFLCKWLMFGPEDNSWEPLDTLRLNMSLIDYINEKFKEFEVDIYSMIANIKMKQKKKRQRVLEEDLKVAIMQRVYPFCPKEYRVYQVAMHLLPDPPKEFIKHFEDLVFRSHFFKLDEVQRIQLDELAKNMMELEQIKITVENDIDFEVPQPFTYVAKNICSEEMLIALNNETLNSTAINESQSPTNNSNEPKIEGCKCKNNSCSRETQCCPQLLELPFAYKETRGERKVRLLYQEPIIECNDKCSCNISCLNRVTQQKRNLHLCLFNTEFRGWAVKTMEPIKKNVFILEYTGELLGCGAAGRREVTSYLYDLNMDRKAHGYYTIDAYKYGNLARFVNHSCDPNASMWVVSDCSKDPRNQKLCIFALRDIEKDEEITIDYYPLETVPTTERMNGSRSDYKECFCESNKCRGTIY